MSGTTRRETHEVVWEGRLTGDEFRDLVLDGLRRTAVPSMGHHGISLELTIGSTLMPTKWPDVHFSVTRDELWFFKPTPEEPRTDNDADGA